jgi:hypothetical protein
MTTSMQPGQKVQVLFRHDNDPPYWSPATLRVYLGEGWWIVAWPAEDQGDGPATYRCHERDIRLVAS